MLYITEIFESIQGETSKAGLMTSFVRLSGCPLRCRWCDSTYTYEKGKPWSIEEISEKLTNLGWKHVCVTGGEPLAQCASIELLQRLVDEGFLISLETSGALTTKEVPKEVKIILDIKCPGSGMSDKNDWGNITLLRQSDEVKFVLADRKDYDWAKKNILQYSLFSKVDNVLLSPAWRLLSPEKLVAWMVEDKLPARLNLQNHRYIWDPTKRGV